MTGIFRMNNFSDEQKGNFVSFCIRNEVFAVPISLPKTWTTQRDSTFASVYKITLQSMFVKYIFYSTPEKC